MGAESATPMIPEQCTRATVKPIRLKSRPATLPPIDMEPDRGSWKTFVLLKGPLSGSMLIGRRVNELASA